MKGDEQVTDLFDGWGNGSLHIHIVERLANCQDGPATVYIGFDFHLSDWRAIFETVLQVPEGEAYIQGQDVNEHFEKKSFSLPIINPRLPFTGTAL